MTAAMHLQPGVTRYACRGAGSGRAMRLAWGVLLLVCIAVLAGCGRGDVDRLQRARVLLERNDRAAALVEVKALIQVKPKLGEARLMLGTMLLDGGDPLAAEIELRRALELGQAQALVLPPLARALLAANQVDKLVTQYGALSLPDALAMAQLKTTVAEAEALLGRLPAAKASLALALGAKPDHEPARLLQARVSAVTGDLAAALAQVDDVLAANPKSADGWVLKGDLQARQKADPAELIKAYQQALAAKPDLASAHTALITLYLAQRNADAARTQHEAMRKVLPRHPQTLMFEGQLAFLKGDLARAREVFQALLRVTPNHLPLLHSAGAVELKLNAPGQAEVLLSKALSLQPDHPTSRRLAAQAYLALGQPARVLALVEPMIAGRQPDAEALTLAARARLLSGEPEAAAALFERAGKARPNDPKIRTAVALSHLARGQGDAALAELQSVAASDTGTAADMALIATQMRRKAWEPALQAIAALDKKLPSQPLGPQLRGQVLLQKRDVPAARQAFEQALARDSSYFPAVAALAGLDLVDKKPEAARARFDALLKANPKSAPTHLALAELDARSGAGRAAVAARLEAGIKASPTDLSLRLALVDHHLETNDPKAAVAAAQAALSQLPEHFELMTRLGRAQLVIGEQQQATNTYNRMVALQPKAPVGHLGLAETQMAANDLAGASRSIQRAQELVPDHLGAQRLAITVALRQKKPELALAQARQVQQQRPTVAVGWLLEGELLILQKKWDEAIKVLRVALGKAEPAQTSARLHHALSQAGRAAEADALAKDWALSHPQDMAFLFYLGDQALLQKNYPEAETRYRAVLKLNPGHALSLNNVAWLLMQQNKPGALELAEQAVRAAPDQPALRDTLAMALAADNQLPKALALQKDTVAMRPDDPFLRFNLASLYVKAGEKRQAKAELDRLAVLGDRFSKQAEVAALSKGLGGRQ